jgi:hypothetical protein
MSDVFDEAIEQMADVDGEPQPRGSLIDQLRRDHEAIREETTHDIDIPGMHGRLFCRYRVLDSRELDANVRKVRDTIPDRAQRLITVTLDNLIQACVEFYVRTDDGEEVPVREYKEYEGDRSLPVRYDENLADFLLLKRYMDEPYTSRGVVLALFGNNELAASSHAADLIRWMMRSPEDVEQFLGGV